MSHAIELPPLPPMTEKEWVRGVTIAGFTDSQMVAFARAAVEQDRARQAVAGAHAPDAVAPPDPREAMQIALDHIKRGEEQATWADYAVCVDQARDVLRAALGDKE